MITKMTANYTLEAYRKYLNPAYADYLERMGLAITVKHAQGAVTVEGAQVADDDVGGSADEVQVPDRMEA